MLQGQWMGQYTGDSSGRVITNVDRVEDHFEAVLHLTCEGGDEPPSVVLFSTQDLGARHSVDAEIAPIDFKGYVPRPWAELAPRYPKRSNHSESAKLQLEVADNRLKITADTNLDVHLEAALDLAVASERSKIAGRTMTWDQFKNQASDGYSSGYLFRGQMKAWSLCTAFHRRKRFRMHAFTSIDVRQLHQRLSAITPHFFDLTVPDQNGAFFNLLQHHGYPTPLLDWSHSPYVAAFFAFRDLPIGYRGEDVVRIYLFNAKAWAARYNQIQHLDPPFPHLSVMEFIAIANPRIVPQQAATTVTNLHDIEAYVLQCEAETQDRFLEAIDIRADERDKAMKDLRVMGITAGSMFPGIDGICEELVERNFAC